MATSNMQPCKSLSEMFKDLHMLVAIYVEDRLVFKTDSHKFLLKSRSTSQSPWVFQQVPGSLVQVKVRKRALS